MSIGVKLKIVTGTYPFQGSRAKYSNISPICELCGENDETLEHFQLECKLLYAAEYTLEKSFTIIHRVSYYIYIFTSACRLLLSEKIF
jgi:hypothetical protein